MSSFSLELQKGVRAALTSASAVTSLVSTRIFDEAPHNVVYPYIRFGGIIPTSDDTDGSTGADVKISVEAYSQATGRVEATTIAEAIRSALHRNETAISLTGINVIEMICENYFVDVENDGRGYKATIVFSVLLQTA